MSDPDKIIEAEIKGWTPVFDSMIPDYGAIGALIFGRIWRYCKMKDKVCTASLSKIATELGLDKSTVSRYATRLVEDGFLVDLTPDLKGKHHTYADSGKAKISIKMAAEPLHNATPSTLNNTTVAHEPLHSATPSTLNNGQNDPTVAQNNTPLHCATPINRKILRDNKETKNIMSPNGDRSVVFTFWQSTHGHLKAKLTKERKAKIDARLKEGYSLDEIKTAIIGCKLSPFHQGENDQGQVYDDLCLILRDGTHVEKFIAFTVNLPDRYLEFQTERIREELKSSLGCPACGANPGYREDGRAPCVCNPMHEEHARHVDYEKYNSLLKELRRLKSAKQGQKQTTPRAHAGVS